MNLIKEVLVIVVLFGSWPGVGSCDEEYYTFDELYEEAEELFDDYTPDDIREVLRFPSPSEWRFFWRELYDALQSQDYDELAWILPELRMALVALENVSGMEGYAAWLKQKIDYAEMSDAAIRYVPEKRQFTPPKRTSPKIIPPPKPIRKIPIDPRVQKKRTSVVKNPENWKRKLQNRPRPEGAEELVPLLKKVFAQEGMPGELVWVAEVESSMNPQAVSPAGAKGLFQLMPATAARFDLRLTPGDERVDPEKSARAAARYMRVLFRQFESWPLVFAAYNAGEGRVARLLKKWDAKSFDEIAEYLPSETQMYVPKLLAAIELREGVKGHKISSPK